MRLFRLIFPAIALGIFACDKTKEEVITAPATSSPESTLFTLINPGQSGLAFNNELTEAPNTNILMYEYFYNGGGVATADFNNDGLIDVYMTSNMQENKLFLNQGNFKFKDITNASGVGGRSGPWKTGVSVADVNGDKRLDIFVCYSGMVKEENRINQLFINQGNNNENIPTFVESSRQYGLTNPAFTNQAYFFDYDRDSDLDLLLLNHNPVNLPILNEVSTATMLQKDDPQKGIRLLVQEKGKFKDVTVNSGINGSALAYGLGAGIADLNNDQWPDVYISNDYSVPDYLYINNKNGTFTNTIQEALGHTSQFSMGNDIADVNNDGRPEIVTLDMLPEDNRRQKLLMAPDNYAKFDLNVRSGFYYQYMRNMFHVNNGDGTFSEIGQLAGISNTDWSWAALLADYDNNGYKDLLVTNGYVRDYTNLDFIKYMDGYVKNKGRLVREEVLGIIEHMPASNVVNYIFSNENGYTFKKRTREWGLEKASNSNGAAYADFDNDGDLDLIINNINQNAFLYRNNSERSGNRSLAIKLEGEGMNTSGIGGRITVWVEDKQQVVEQMPARGYLSAVSPVLHVGVGAKAAVDSVEIRWPSGKYQKLRNVTTASPLIAREVNAKEETTKVMRTETMFTKIKSPVVHASPKSAINDFKRQPLLLTQLSHGNTKLVKGDVNNDGLEDVYITGGNGTSGKLFIQQSNNTFQNRVVKDFDYPLTGIEADAAFADVNADGFLDLYVAMGGYHSLTAGDAHLQDRLYLNDSHGNFTVATDWLPEVKSSKGCVLTGDFNNDGRPDIFLGGRVTPGRYPETPESFLLINEGNKFSDQTNTIAPQLRKIGMVTDAVALDINHDHKLDLILAGEWMRITVLLNENQKFADRTTVYFDKPMSGWWNSLDTADFNNDGYVDLIAGNMGLNSQCKASEQQPAEIFFKDFDNNGSIDPLFCFYIQDKRYPYITRDELLDQIGSMRSRFTDYESYASATITDIIKQEDLDGAGHLTATDFQTRVFTGSASGKFTSHDLPREAQYSPVYASAVVDVDRDGNSDLLLCGNNSKMKIKIGKYDANYGVLLKGDGTGKFTYVDQFNSGLSLKGDVRSIIRLGDNFWFGINEAPIVTFKLKQTGAGRGAIANLQR
ncbi:MAG TPA: VCBS repeat-containing protein [Chryseosolibacter sp.]